MALLAGKAQSEETSQVQVAKGQEVRKLCSGTFDMRKGESCAQLKFAVGLARGKGIVQRIR